MTNKIFLSLTALCISIAVMAQTDTLETTLGVHPYNEAANVNVSTNYAHWSIIPRIGFNRFDGDFKGELKHAVYAPAVGLAVEYDFNPIWGIGLEYMFDMYHVFGKTDYASTAADLLHGYVHKVGAYGSMDFIGLFYPHDKSRLFSLHGILGGGYSFYRSTIMYPDSKFPHSNTASRTPETMKNYDGSFYVQFGLNAEFALNRTLSLGLRANYNYFMTDNVDGRTGTTSKNNDGIYDITLNLRIKLKAVNQSHMRNLGGEEGNLDYAPQYGKAVALQPTVHDTVIIYRDTTIFHTREVIREEAADKSFSQYYYVYFQSGKAEIDDEGLVTIQQVADRMEADTSLYAVVEGYCDNTGSNNFNYALGDKRAENVMDELREEHGIEPDHLYSGGIGKLIGRRSTASYGPNRRAVIRLVDKATFDRLRGELNERKAQRTTNGGSALVPLAVSKALSEKKNPFEGRNTEKVTVDKSTTLSQLARKYYNNTHCWVYIYIANRKVIENPNALKPGTQLVIPELTEEELKLSKEGCLRLYGIARR